MLAPSQIIPLPQYTHNDVAEIILLIIITLFLALPHKHNTSLQVYGTLQPLSLMIKMQSRD